MTIPSLPALDRTSPTFRSDLDTFFLAQLPATTAAFNAEVERLNAIGYGSYNATSTTSLSIGIGSKSLTVETGRGFAVGQALLIASTASPNNYMAGQVASYDRGTGALTVNVTESNGSGTVTAWTVSVSALKTLPTVTQRTITGADTLIASDQGKLINASGAFTLAVTAAATLGNGWYCYVRNTSNGDVTIDPASGEQIDGAYTLVLKPGFTVLLTCTGTAFGVMELKRRTYDNIASYTVSSTFVVPADTYVIRGYAWGAGAPGTSTEGGAGGGCAFGDIAVTPGETVAIAIASNTAKVATWGPALLTANPASGVTAGTASNHASVTNGTAYSGGYGSVGSYGGGASSGSPLGAGFPNSGQPGGAGWGGYGGVGGGGGIAQGGGSGGGGSGGGGSLRTPANYFSEPLLKPLTGAGGAAATANGAKAGDGGPGGGGGGGWGSGGVGGVGGVGGGGGGGDGGGGNGGFGGGGGSGGFGGGNGGYGGGGGSPGGTGGAACVLIYY